MVILRKEYLDLIENSFLKEWKITLLIWPRRVGKTFLMKQFYEKLKTDSIWISFEEFFWKTFSSVDSFLQFLSVYGKKDKFKYIFLDEIQLVPGISWILKKIYDDGLWYKILCSWSWSFQIFNQIEDSLLGRVNIIDIFPLNFEEFFYYKTNINLKKLLGNSLLFEKYYVYLEEYLKFWWYPEVVLAWDYEKKVSILKNIYNFWLDKDIKFILSGDELLDFIKFFRWFAFRITSIFKVNSLANELNIKFYKIKKFVEILKKSYVIFELSPLVSKYSYEVRSGKKYYFVDVGLLNIIKENFTIEERWDLIENYVISEIFKKSKSFLSFYFRKKTNQSEIDMVVKNMLNAKYYPIEIKSSLSKTIPKIFYSFFNDYDSEKGIVFNKNNYGKVVKNGKEVQFLPYFFADLYTEFLR